MSAHPARMTGAEFLAWEALQETKWEFDGVRPVAMVGGTAAHTAIQGNLITALTTRLRGHPCRPFGNDLQVPTGDGRYRYPDALVTCTPLAPSATQAPEPVVVFEVLSDGTARTDRTVKLIEYRGVPSLQRYVMIEQDQVLATVVTRMELGWSIDVLRGGGTLAMPEIGIEVPVDELYVDVAFERAD